MGSMSVRRAPPGGAEQGPGTCPTPEPGAGARGEVPHILAEDWGWRHAGRRAWAVRHLDFRLDKGERVLLLGASGAGKSTLLAALAGVLGGHDDGESEGRLEIDGRAPERLRGHAGFVMQDPEAQIVLARVGDDVAFGCENLGVAEDEIWGRVAAGLDAVGLDVELGHSTAHLSGGQQQRLILAGALAMGADLLLLDEPTANLDPAGVIQVRDAVAAAVADRRRSLVVIEHRCEVWAPLVDRVVVLTPEGVIADGPPDAVFTERAAELAEMGVWVPGDRGGPDTGDGSACPDVTPDEANPPTRGPDTSMTTPDTGDGSSCHQDTGDQLTARDLAIGYGTTVVRDGLDLAIPRGVSTVVTGPNGSGKTTLALTLAGLQPPLAGTLSAHALAPPAGGPPDAWKSRDLLTRIGMVFQSPGHQFVAATVFDEIAVGLRALHRDEAAVAATVEGLLRRLRLDHLAKANPFTLSGGEARRLSVATVLACNPAVVILDEPTFGQDRRTWTQLVDLIRELRDQGTTIISVTHDQDFISAVGDHRIDLTPPPPTRPGDRAAPSEAAVYPDAFGSGQIEPSPLSGGGTKRTVPNVPPPPRRPLDRVNPVTRLAAAMILTFPLLVTLDWQSAITVTALETLIWAILQGRDVARGLRTLALRAIPFLVAAPLAAASMALYGAPGGETYFSWGLIIVSQQSLSYAAAVAARVLALGTAVLVTMTDVDPTDMADGLAQVWHLPARLVLGTLAAVRLIAALMSDWRAMQMARRSRGLGDHRRVRRFAGLAFALLVSAIRRGSALATAMEARGFGRGHRTWARKSTVGLPDAIALAVATLVVASGIGLALATGSFRWIGQVMSG